MVVGQSVYYSTPVKTVAKVLALEGKREVRPQSTNTVRPAEMTSDLTEFDLAPTRRPRSGPQAGPTHIAEEVTLSPDGDHYTGPFTLDAYDTSGNISTSFTGVITATRITMATKVGGPL
jgi:hypothetical protein